MDLRQVRWLKAVFVVVGIVCHCLTDDGGREAEKMRDLHLVSREGVLLWSNDGESVIQPICWVEL